MNLQERIKACIKPIGGTHVRNVFIGENRLGELEVCRIIQKYPTAYKNPVLIARLYPDGTVKRYQDDDEIKGILIMHRLKS